MEGCRMSVEIDELLGKFESRAISRRELAMALAALVASVPAAAQGGAPTAIAQGRTINHVSLAVTDVERSAAFYREIVGLQPAGKGPYGEYRFKCSEDPYAVVLHQADQPGFKRGGRLHKMGLDAQDTSELFFDAVKVPKANVLGDAGKGFGYLSQFLGGERLISSVDAVALAQTAFDLTLEFVQQRKAFGRPVGTFQHNRFVMGEMRAQIDAVQTFVDQCVLEYNAGRLTAELAAESKLLSTELAGKVVDSCVQLHGGAGYMEEYRISRLYRDARVMRIFAGTSEIMKEIIGRSLGLDERKLK